MKANKGDIGQIIRFGIVGVGATLTHLLAALTLSQVFDVAPLLANLIAFLVAFVVSFSGHYIWTFSRPGNHRRAIFRFFITALSGFFVNTIVLASLLADGRISEPLSFILAVAVIPVVTYFVSRIWAFKAAE